MPEDTGGGSRGDAGHGPAEAGAHEAAGFSAGDDPVGGAPRTGGKPVNLPATLAKAGRIGLMLLAAAVLLWAFATVAARYMKRPAPGPRQITLTLLHWGTPQETAIVRSLLHHYEKLHPGVRIKRIHANAFGTKLRTMFSAGAPPDIFYLSHHNVPEFAHLHMLLNISPYIKRQEEKGRFRWIHDFYPLLLNAFRYDGHRAGRGPLYGLPKDFTTSVMYVNTTLFHRAGAPVPYHGWTWKTYQRDMAKIAAIPPTAHGRFYGGVLNTWPGELTNIFWTYGGGFFARGNFKQTLFAFPADQRAMRMIYRVRFKAKSVYNATGLAKSPSQEFFTGHLGCVGPVGRWKTPQFREIHQFNWDVVPVPYTTAPASIINTVAWAISRQTPHPRQAFDLLKYLCGPRGQAREARLGLAIPSLKSVAHSPAFLSPNLKPLHSAVFLQAMAHARLQQVPVAHGQFYQIVNDQISDALQMGQEPLPKAAATIQRRWHAYLTSPLQTQHFGPMPWRMWGMYIGMAAAVAAGLLALGYFRGGSGRLGRRQELAGMAFVAPWVIGFLVFALGPMIVSLLLSMAKWSALEPLSGARFVGVANYRQMFLHDRIFWKSLKVTFYFTLLAVPLSQVASLGVALLMNLRLRGITVFRTIYFVPSVVSGVSLAVLWLLIFNKNYGLMNALLAPLAHLLGTSPPDWFGQDAARWAIPAFVIMGLWGVGSGMVIYLAGLKGVPASLYEAATIDGAGPVRRFFAVTVPMLSPLLFYNLVMAIIGSLQVFTQAQVMTQGGPNNDTLFYVLYLYQQAFESHNMGYASALAWVLFVVILLLTLAVFRMSRNWVYYEGLKA